MFYSNKPNPGCLNGSPKHFPQSWHPLFPRAVATNYHKLGGLKQHKLTVLKPQSPKPRCWQGYAPSRHSREECFLASSGFWWLLLTLGIPCFVDISLQSLSLSLHDLSPMCLSVFSFSVSYTNTTNIYIKKSLIYNIKWTFIYIILYIFYVQFDKTWYGKMICSLYIIKYQCKWKYLILGDIIKTQ